MEAWRAFVKGNWTSTSDVRDFLNKNYTPYDGGADILCGAIT